ncbi:BZ3500_MvSof-1268-A1-R1_Chr1-1g01037 [Microbotryum saponariae]|uniref:BZ3500_MvSof-1268-A1-R1_Chr1-1g01037 protein n=1 Tax=Microbotryum saponariae TaxID=289078 RepID=A0A2X0K963_9BASI|nr:BZ3500_MvSof-1268-A1-R1_Chr1-1g01037 [Microbotryum saponariae]SCZ93254.1 BZ3501_MvSof-1269-A2-R1_Chr1-1g00634 [Microbotryum saponariae]
MTGPAPNTSVTGPAGSKSGIDFYSIDSPEGQKIIWIGLVQDEKDEADVAFHLLTLSPDKLPYPARRFINETKRLLSDSEERLKGRDYPIAQARAKLPTDATTSSDRFHLGSVRVRCEALHGGFLNVEQRIHERSAAKADDFVTKMLSAGVEGPKKNIEWVYAAESAEPN